MRRLEYDTAERGKKTRLTPKLGAERESGAYFSQAPATTF